MKFTQLIGLLSTVFLMTACQSTPSVVETSQHSQNTYQMNQGFKADTQMRMFTNDGQLAYSLANRALPQDQLMVLAFEKQTAQSLYVQNGYFVEIRGSRADDPGKANQQLAWRHYDANAKRISGPK